MRLFFKFAATGAVGTAFHYFLLIIFVEIFGVSPSIAAVIGAVGGGLCNYLLNYFVNFRLHTRHVIAAPKFLLVVAIGAVFNGLFVRALTVAGLNYFAAQLIATVVILIGNFFISKLWIFKKVSN